MYWVHLKWYKNKLFTRCDSGTSKELCASGDRFSLTFKLHEQNITFQYLQKNYSKYFTKFPLVVFIILHVQRDGASDKYTDKNNLNKGSFWHFLLPGILFFDHHQVSTVFHSSKTYLCSDNNDYLKAGNVLNSKKIYKIFY